MPLEMTKTLLLISMGQLNTHVLEAVSRTRLFGRIVVASRTRRKAVERANNALVGAGIEGVFPRFEAIELDADSPDFVQRISGVGADVIFTAPSLMPWWKLGERPDLGAVPFGAWIALQLAPVLGLRARLAEADLPGLWINASYPDVINPVLAASGAGPLCGVGNVQEPIAKIQAGVGARLGLPPQEVAVSLVAQHAFEYFAMREEGAERLPPHLLQVTAGGRDVTDIADAVLKEPFPFPYDLGFNRVTASAALVAFGALTSDAPQRIHLPGPLGLIGGYPVQASRHGVEIDLPAPWTPDAARRVNEASMQGEGIDAIERDGTIRFTPEAHAALTGLIGPCPAHLALDRVAEQARRLLDAIG